MVRIRISSIAFPIALLFLGFQVGRYGEVLFLSSSSDSASFYNGWLQEFDVPTEAIEPASSNQALTPNRIESDTPAGATTIRLATYDNRHCEGQPREDLVRNHDQVIPVDFQLPLFPISVKVTGKGFVEIYIREQGDYEGVLVEDDGCFYFNVHQRETRHVRFRLFSEPLGSKVQIPPSLQQKFSTSQDSSGSKVRFVFSVQSSKYFGYQVLASAYSFLHSNQTNATWTRLLTSKVPDDLAERFPTFTAPKSIHSIAYHPINKPDVISKWFASSDAPHPDDTIVVVDPDSWFLKDVYPWTVDVRKDHAVGQGAYYTGDPIVQELWKEICLLEEEICAHRSLDLVGVPYILKATDLERVAPLWKRYTLIIKAFLQRDSFRKKFGHMGFDWAAEMVGYNAACAHLNIKTKEVRDLQVRDIESDTEVRKWERVPTIHVGRAWFPTKDEEMAGPWRSEDDGGTNQNRRIQVWCKCNATAADIQPWPIPNTGEFDFVSRHTLTILHRSVEYFGAVPVNESFRRQNDYNWAAP